MGTLLLITTTITCAAYVAPARRPKATKLHAVDADVLRQEFPALKQKRHVPEAAERTRRHAEVLRGGQRERPPRRARPRAKGYRRVRGRARHCGEVHQCFFKKRGRVDAGRHGSDQFGRARVGRRLCVQWRRNCAERARAPLESRAVATAFIKNGLHS